MEAAHCADEVFWIECTELRIILFWIRCSTSVAAAFAAAIGSFFGATAALDSLISTSECVILVSEAIYSLALSLSV